MRAGWEHADRIRRMLAAAADAAKQDGQAVEPGTPFGDWLVWAAEQADRLDPLKESPPSIIDSESKVFRWVQPVWRIAETE